jgi:hypothetical protein
VLLVTTNEAFLINDLYDAHDHVSSPNVAMRGYIARRERRRKVDHRLHWDVVKRGKGMMIYVKWENNVFGK